MNAVRIFLTASILMVAVGCSEDDDDTTTQSCIPGATVRCGCPRDGGSTQICGPSGRVEACVCPNTDAGADAVPSRDGGDSRTDGAVVSSTGRGASASNRCGTLITGGTAGTLPAA